MGLTASGAWYEAYFGNSAASSGDYGVAGAYSEDGEGAVRGAFLFFKALLCLLSRHRLCFDPVFDHPNELIFAGIQQPE
jgi:hypothetical protein